MSIKQNTIALHHSDNGGMLQLAPRADWSDMGRREHFVQFYENDVFLLDSVTAFIGSGLRAGDGAILVATRAHREAFEDRLAKEGVNLAELRSSGQFIALDAAETLSKFMVNDTPNQKLFEEVVGSLIVGAARNGRYVRAFGEMVALLWAEGNQTAAIRLEEFWNDLGKAHCFSLFCAYPMHGFEGELNSQPLLHICKEHSRVIPAESYTCQPDHDERLRCITLLQQKASSLEAEISERRNAESTLREEQTRLLVALAVAKLGVWELDLLTNVLVCSDQCKAHFGLSPEETLSFERWCELIHPDDREETQIALRGAINQSADYTMEYRVIDSRGELRWISAMGRCFHNGSHRMLGVTLDITDQRRSAEMLEQSVVQRTAELQETIGELEAFSYSISHDMRAPLRSMQGFADILAEEYGEKIGPDGRAYLDRIIGAAERMDRLIRDVLTFSRVARNELKLEPINLDHLVRGILECYPNMQSPQADIVIHGQLGYVLGHAASLTQCLSNLLGNAVKFVARGVQPRVRIWAEAIDARSSNEGSRQEQQMVRVCIQDNGIGIPKEAHEKVFAIFQRLSKHYEGTGIGLAIVKKAAERMEGRVGLKSEPGQGSVFWLELKGCEHPRGV